MGWWVADLLHADPVLLASWVVWVIGSIVLHELGHGWAALRCGDTTPRDTGHMTWNPIVHMGVASLIVFAIIGIAWGAMPVSPSRFRGRHDDAKVALAGPLVNLALALASCVLLVAWLAGAMLISSPTFAANFAKFLSVGVAINIALLTLNLLPIPPLDGSRILADYVPSYARLIAYPQAGIVGFVLLIVVLRSGGFSIIERSMSLTSDLADWGLRLVGSGP